MICRETGEEPHTKRNCLQEFEEIIKSKAKMRAEISRGFQDHLGFLENVNWANENQGYRLEWDPFDSLPPTTRRDMGM